MTAYKQEVMTGNTISCMLLWWNFKSEAATAITWEGSGMHTHSEGYGAACDDWNHLKRQEWAPQEALRSIEFHIYIQAPATDQTKDVESSSSYAVN